MDQETASRCARQMAEGIESLYRAEQMPVGQDQLGRFRDAAFYQAYEFIPDGAPALVLVVEAGPLLVAVEEDRFYKLSFATFDMTDVGIPTTVCEMQRIRPDTATLSVEATYQNTVAGIMTRTTTWGFSVDGKSAIAFQSQHSTEAAQNDEEKFARALAGAMGWPGPGQMSPP